MANNFDWAITKMGPAPSVRRANITDYPNADRANKAYSHFISGYTEEEIAKFLSATPEEIELDIQHVRSCLPTRTIISQENDRNRILLQRTESQKYRRLLSAALDIPVEQYLTSGVSPVGPLKEFREAVGMQERPGGINVNVEQKSLTVNAGGSGSNGLTSSEDILRRVMDRMAARQELPPQEAPIEVEAEAVGAGEGDEIPDPDE